MVLTDDGYDSLHMVHIAVLGHPHRLVDLIIGGVNGYQSLRTLKGQKWPAIRGPSRTQIPPTLAGVDYAAIFSGLGLTRVIEGLLPDIHVRGTEYGDRERRTYEKLEVDLYGGRLGWRPFFWGYSATSHSK